MCWIQWYLRIRRGWLKRYSGLREVKLPGHKSHLTLIDTQSHVRDKPLETLIETQSHVGDKPLKFHVVCPKNGTVVLKGLKRPHFLLYRIHRKLLPPLQPRNKRSQYVSTSAVVQPTASLAEARCLARRVRSAHSRRTTRRGLRFIRTTNAMFTEATLIDRAVRRTRLATTRCSVFAKEASNPQTKQSSADPAAGAASSKHLCPEGQGKIKEKQPGALGNLEPADKTTPRKARGAENRNRQGFTQQVEALDMLKNMSGKAPDKEGQCTQPVLSARPPSRYTDVARQFGEFEGVAGRCNMTEVSYHLVRPSSPG